MYLMTDEFEIRIIIIMNIRALKSTFIYMVEMVVVALYYISIHCCW